MHYIAEIFISLLLVAAGIFGLVGSFGLLKLPDLVTRLHAPTKASTLGIGGVLLASMGAHWATTGTVSTHELLITLFIFMTAPITANFIAKAHMHRQMSAKDVPPTGTGRDWATFDTSGTPIEPVMTDTLPRKN